MREPSTDLVHDTLLQEQLVISCQTRFNPSDEEWDHWLEAVTLLKRRVSTPRLLVVTEGGHPTKPQLDRLRDVNDCNPPTAIVSTSVALRFLASALTFVNPKIRCYAPREIQGAFRHLGLDPRDWEGVSAAVGRLNERLGLLPVLLGKPAIWGARPRAD